MIRQASRKQAEEALRASEENFRSSLDNSPLGIRIVTADGETLYANQAILDIYGYSSVEEMGAIPVKKRYTPESYAAHQERKKKRSRGEFVPPTYEISIVRKSGEIRHLLTSRREVLWNGERRFQMVYQDITERKRAEEQILQRNRELTVLNEIAATLSQSPDLHQILNSALPKVMGIVGMDSGFIALIEEGEEVVIRVDRGLSPEYRELVAGLKVGEGLAGIVAQSGHSVFAEDISKDLRIARKDAVKRERLRAYVGVPLKSRDKVLGALCVMGKKPRQVSPSDIQLLETIGSQLGIVIENTRLVHEAAEVEALRKVDRLRSQLLSIVSHELRTPLTTIKGYAAMLRDYDERLGHEEKRQYLESIDRSSNRLTDLIEELLDMSRLEAGMIKIQKASTSISELMRAAVGEAQVRVSDHVIELNLREPLPTVNIDANRIRQVLGNLIDNAAKYSIPGTKVTISAIQSGQELLISVADQGIGIAAKDLSKIFTPMYRVESRLVKKAGGLGLGLSICKGLVEGHGGRIWMESEKGKGSTCFFTLPVDAQGTSEKGV